MSSVKTFSDARTLMCLTDVTFGGKNMDRKTHRREKDPLKSATLVKLFMVSMHLCRHNDCGETLIFWVSIHQ